jgi:methyl halide transferase
MSDLLSPTGTLICLEFPLYKDPSAGGPPWALREETYIQHLARPGEEIEYKDGLVVVPETITRNSKALVRKARWMPERTHEIGKGTDHISLWTHAN